MRGGGFQLVLYGFLNPRNVIKVLFSSFVMLFVLITKKTCEHVVKEGRRIL